MRRCESPGNDIVASGVSRCKHLQVLKTGAIKAGQWRALGLIAIRFTEARRIF